MLTNLELFKLTPGNHSSYARLQVNNFLHVIPVLLSCSVSAPAALNDPCFSFIQQLHSEPPGKHASGVTLDGDDGRLNGLEFLSADIAAIVPLDCDCSLLFSQVLCKSWKQILKISVLIEITQGLVGLTANDKCISALSVNKYWYQTRETEVHQISKHKEVSWRYDAYVVRFPFKWDFSMIALATVVVRPNCGSSVTQAGRAWEYFWGNSRSLEKMYTSKTCLGICNTLFTGTTSKVSIEKLFRKILC